MSALSVRCLCSAVPREDGHLLIAWPSPACRRHGRAAAGLPAEPARVVPLYLSPRSRIVPVAAPGRALLVEIR